METDRGIQDYNEYRFSTKVELTAFLDGVDAAKGYVDSLVFKNLKEYRGWVQEAFGK